MGKPDLVSLVRASPLAIVISYIIFAGIESVIFIQAEQRRSLRSLISGYFTGFDVERFDRRNPVFQGQKILPKIVVKNPVSA